MKILNATEFVKWDLPSGKLTCRWVKYRNKYQYYVGRNFVSCASGDTQKEAKEELHRLYNI